MQLRFTDEEMMRILEQSLVYICACPAQVSQSINELRKLYDYQKKCLNLTDMDTSVHQRIADAVSIAHAEMERCLEDILRLEGWDMQTYEMPESMKQKFLQLIQQQD